MIDHSNRHNSHISQTYYHGRWTVKYLKATHLNFGLDFGYIDTFKNIICLIYGEKK